MCKIKNFLCIRVRDSKALKLRLKARQQTREDQTGNDYPIYIYNFAHIMEHLLKVMFQASFFDMHSTIFLPALL